VRPPRIDRRSFLGLGLATAGAVVLQPTIAATAQAGDGAYGPLLEPNDLGIRVPEGFTVRELARSGARVGPRGYIWHSRPDGGATFDTDDGGWIYVSNSETGDGGAGALRFDESGALVDAYRILEGTVGNCAGGPTPWGTWLSCEEFDRGRVWECDPLGERPGTVRPALGTFKHEAACADPEREQLYLTEDEDDGRFYRFTPSTWRDLDTGLLEVAVVADNGQVSWREIPDPEADSTRTRNQVDAATVFNRGEGIWYADGVVYMVTTGDGKVWAYDAERERMRVLYDRSRFDEPPLKSPDNITVTPSGEVLVAEDIDDDQDLILISSDGTASPFIRITEQHGSEITGPAFDPSGTRLYFSSQRGPSGRGEGTTYVVTGPFRTVGDVPASTTPAGSVTSLREGRASGGSSGSGESGDDGLSPLWIAGGLGVALAVGMGIGWRLRRRNAAAASAEPDAPT
jgi:secreted PhoX family phosphatase